ncbi:hypothetical protein TanjilG_24349 [Lupinus angustifolius]|uniref:RNase H type-1 domain-containing protein n=1 Tax=Lupinus angustifolius TaxID=3871 RepID=A0A1J7HFK9_LUPAN|nr:PREDICTED: uncharacterized protein LOC109348024 [Lupinus angustifolius]OIW11655.1 hypothetical protein TanjilG_24349 [Lupinus angustifolius]
MDDGSNNQSRCMVSMRFTVACAAVSAIALVNQDDENDQGNEKVFTVYKVIIAAMITHVIVSHLFTLLSSSCSGSQFETTEDDADGESDGWSFPPNGWIKCNVDGSAPEDKASGCGGVFRDSTGSWLYGFAISLDRGTSSAIELSAISIALDIAWDRGFRRLILETDSLTVADVVNNKDGACSHRSHEKKLVENIRDKKKKRKWDVRIVHSKREGNKVADWLANLSHGLQVGDQIELPKLPPGCFSCQKLMFEDTRLAKAQVGRSMIDRLRCIGMKGSSFLLVMFLVLSPYVVHVPN